MRAEKSTENSTASIDSSTFTSTDREFPTKDIAQTPVSEICLGVGRRPWRFVTVHSRGTLRFRSRPWHSGQTALDPVVETLWRHS